MSRLRVPAAWGGARGCCCFCIRAWYRCSRTILIMASRTIDNIVTDDHMQLDKVIDNYFNLDISDPNPLTSSNINSHYHTIDTIGLQNIKDYQKNSKFSCLHINIRSLPDKFDKFKISYKFG